MKSLYIIIVLSQIILFSCNSESTSESDAPQKFVSRSMFGDKWPLTIDKGTLKCLDYGGVVFISEDGQIFVLMVLLKPMEELLDILRLKIIGLMIWKQRRA